jgi:cytochrome P450
MTELSNATEPPDRDVDGVLNRFIYSLYARAKGAEPAWSPIESIIADADRIDAILHDGDRFRKNYSLLGALGDSRFTTDGRDWQLRRELTQAAYAGAGAAANRELVASVYAEVLAGITAPQQIQRALLTASARVFLRAFGHDGPTDSLLAFFDQARLVIKRLQYHSWIASPPDNLSVLRRQADVLLDDFAREMDHAPELRAWMQELRRNGGKIPNFSAQEEFLMNFLAGIETTAATLSFAIDRLGIDPWVGARLFDEVDANESPYIDCYLNETLRYFPAIPFVVRQAASDATVHGAAFASGQLVLLSIVGVHHDPRFWKEPEIFDCSRTEFLHSTYDRRAFIPFLGGPRSCGGARLARMELIEGLKAFIRRFQVEREGCEIEFDYGLALRPNSWARLGLSKRN